jgi:ribosomal protein L40E
MKSKYRKDQIRQALDEIAHDKEASEKLWRDLTRLVAEHIRSWLESKERPQNRVNGIILEKNESSRLLCLKCRSMNMTTATFCNHCGVQLQDTLDEKTRKKVLMGLD